MRKLVLFFLCIGLASFAFSQVPIPPYNKPPSPDKPSPRLLPPPPKLKHESFVYNSSVELEWRGTAEEAERAFTTSLEDEVDVVRDRESKKTITGTLTIVDSNGKLQGKVEVKDGKLHGEEIFYNTAGKIIETSYWVAGKRSKTPPPRVKETRIQNTENDSTKKPSNPFLVPTPPLSLPNPWSDFIYDSPEEKAFWDKLPDWSSKGLSFTNFRFKRNARGETIESNSSEGYNGYVKCTHWLVPHRTLYQFVDGYVVKEKLWNNKGHKRWENTYKEGKLDGLHTEWYLNGQKRYELNYKDDKLCTAKVWLPDGKDCLKAKIIDGNGVVVYYYENGQKQREHNYKNGKKHGLSTEWYENGKKKTEDNWKDGERNGLRIYYDKKGNETSRRRWLQPIIP